MNRSWFLRALFFSSWLLLVPPDVSGAEVPSDERVESLRITRGELSVLFRDNSRSPRILSGLGSLRNVAAAPDFEAFDPDDPGASAGLNFEHVISGHRNPNNAFTPRKGRYDLFQLPDGASAMLVRKAEDDPWALASTFKYTVSAPHAVDFEFRCRAEKPELFGARGYAVLFFADYMNDVAGVPIHFRGIAGPGGAEQWLETEMPPGHADYNQGGTIHHQNADDLKYDADHNFRLNLWSYDYPRFTEPFYFGRTTNGMTLILMFDRTHSATDEVRFSLFKFKVPKRPRPAWDFQYVIHRVEKDREYGFRGRLVWKKFASAEDCREEYRRWREKLAGPKGE